MPAGQRDQSAAALPIRGLATATARFALRVDFVMRVDLVVDRASLSEKGWRGVPEYEIVW